MKTEKMLFVTLDALAYPWCADDAAWFNANPSRAHRVRPSYPDEFPAGLVEQLDFAVVRQIEPGMRTRLPIKPIGRFHDAPEHIAHAIFDLVASAPGGQIISTQQINKRAAELRKAARVAQ